MFRPKLIDTAIMKNSPGNSIASCCFVPLSATRRDVNLDLCCLRNDLSEYLGTFLSKNKRTARVAIF